MELIIERITRNKKVLSFHKVSGDKVTIGRAYDNDVVLQEEHVNPYHAEIDIYEDDGVLLLTDLHSLNGIKTATDEKVEGNTRVNSGDVFTLGKTHIRIVKSNHQVAPTKELSVLEDIASQLNQWYFAALTIVLFWSTLMAYSMVTRFDTIIWSKEAAKYSMLSVALLLIPSVIAISARFAKKEVRFFASIAFCFSILLLFQLNSASVEWLDFNWPSSAVIGFAMTCIEFTLLAAFFWGALYLASNMTMKKISLISILLVTSISGLVFYSKQKNEIQLHPELSAVVLPNSLLLAKAESVTQQLENNKALFARAATEAEKLNKESND